MSDHGVTAVLFDFGGVFTPSPFALLATMEGPDAELLTRQIGHVFGPYDRDTDHPWHRLERGETTMEPAFEEIRALAAADGMDLEPMRVLRHFAGDGTVRVEVVEHVRRLRVAGFSTAIVTNNLHEVRTMWQRMLPVDELFDLVVDSSEEGVRKPDPVIFERALERLGVDAAAAVFLDDVASNVEAARAVGMRGIHVTADPAVALAELEGLLGH